MGRDMTRYAIVTAVLFCSLGACSTDSTAPDEGAAVELVALKAGVYSTCAQTKAGRLLCWGRSVAHGSPWTDVDTVPTELQDGLVVGDFDIANGDFGGAVCAAIAHGATQCWGYYAGWDVAQSYGAPSMLLQDTMVLSKIVTGDGHACGIGADGSANCWGGIVFGKRGGGIPLHDPEWANTIINRVAGGLEFASLGADRYHTCGLTTTSTVYCWGYGPLLGDTLGTFYTTIDDCLYYAPCTWAPIAVRSLSQVQSLAVGGFQSCALDQNAAVWCWQAEGYPYTTGFPKRVDVPEPVASISVGTVHSCAIGSSGSAYCWGDSGPWRGTDDISSSVVEVKTNLRFVSISAGREHTCGIDKQGEAYCWGSNRYGELGDGTNEPSARPLRVRFE